MSSTLRSDILFGVLLKVRMLLEYLLVDKEKNMIFGSMKKVGVSLNIRSKVGWKYKQEGSWSKSSQPFGTLALYR